MYFFAPPLSRSLDADFQKTKRILFRFIPFFLLIVFAFVLSLWYFKDDIKAAQNLAEYITGQKKGPNGGGGDDGDKDGYDEKNGLLEKGSKDKDGNDGKGGTKDGDD